jgi:hypothetical protein
MDKGQTLQGRKEEREEGTKERRKKGRKSNQLHILYKNSHLIQNSKMDKN